MRPLQIACFPARLLLIYTRNSLSINSEIIWNQSCNSWFKSARVGYYLNPNSTHTAMKLISFSMIILSSALLTNCNERKQAVEDQKDATKEAFEQQKDALKPAADAAVNRVEANAEIQKANIKAQMKSSEAQIEADKKKADAEAAAAKARIDAEEKK